MLVEVAQDLDNKMAQKISNTVSSLATQNQLLKAENQGFKRALLNKKKKRKRGKNLFEEFRAQKGNRAIFFSSTKVDATKAIRIEKNEAKEANKAAKAAKAKARKQ